MGKFEGQINGETFSDIKSFLEKLDTLPREEINDMSFVVSTSTLGSSCEEPQEKETFCKKQDLYDKLIPNFDPSNLTKNTRRALRDLDEDIESKKKLFEKEIAHSTSIDDLIKFIDDRLTATKGLIYECHESEEDYRKKIDAANLRVNNAQKELAEATDDLELLTSKNRFFVSNRAALSSIKEYWLDLRNSLISEVE